MLNVRAQRRSLRQTEPLMRGGRIESLSTISERENEIKCQAGLLWNRWLRYTDFASVFPQEPATNRRLFDDLKRLLELDSSTRNSNSEFTSSDRILRH